MHILISICLSFFWKLSTVFSSELIPWDSEQLANIPEKYHISDKPLPGSLRKQIIVKISKAPYKFLLEMQTKQGDLADFTLSIKNYQHDFSKTIDFPKTEELNLIGHRTSDNKISYSLKDKKLFHDTTLNLLIYKNLKFLYDNNILSDAALDDLAKRINFKEFRGAFEKFVDSINSLSSENLSEAELLDQLHPLMEGDKSLYQQSLCAQYIKKWMDDIVAENPDDSFKRIGIKMCTYVNDPALPEYTDIKLIENDLMLALPSTTHEERMTKYLNAIEHLLKLDQSSPVIHSQLKLLTYKYINNDQITFEDSKESYQELLHEILEQTQPATKLLRALKEILQSKDDLIASLKEEKAASQSRIRELENRLHNLQTHSSNAI